MAAELRGAPFTRTLIYGSWDGLHPGAYSVRWDGGAGVSDCAHGGGREVKVPRRRHEELVRRAGAPAHLGPQSNACAGPDAADVVEGRDAPRLAGSRARGKPRLTHYGLVSR
jgi:hypothetical protein